MPIYAVGAKKPQIHPTAFIAPTASIVGDVRIGAGASVWYGAVIRGDTSYAVIGDGANVQENAVIHARAGEPALIGKGVTVAHLAIVHGAVIGDQAMIANGAMVLDGAKIGEKALIAAGSVVLAGAEIPAGMLAAGTPAEVKRSIIGSASEAWVTNNPGAYAQIAQMHIDGLRELAREECDSPGITGSD